MLVRAIGDMSKKVYATGTTKEEVMRQLLEEYQFKASTIKTKYSIYPEPLRIEKERSD